MYVVNSNSSLITQNFAIELFLGHTYHVCNRIQECMKEMRKTGRLGRGKRETGRAQEGNTK